MENHSAGIYYVIPAEVFEDDRLEPSELKFYVLLSGLARSEGYCYASNEYLAARLKSNSRTIQKWLIKLEEFGYIRRELKKIGMVTDRKIFICHARLNNSYTPPTGRGRDAPGRVEDAPQGVVDMPPRASIREEDSSLEAKEEEEKKKKEQRRPTASQISLKFGKFVHMSKEEHEELVKDLGLEKFERVCSEINDYIASKGLKPYKDYPATIRNWIRREKNGHPPNSGRPPSASTIDRRPRDKDGNVIPSDIDGLF
jgi:helix-turn-helix protein